RQGSELFPFTETEAREVAEDQRVPGPPDEDLQEHHHGQSDAGGTHSASGVRRTKAACRQNLGEPGSTCNHDPARFSGIGRRHRVGRIDGLTVARRSAMRVDLYGLAFETPRVSFHLWSPWRASALEHRLFEVVRNLPRVEAEK